MHVILDHSFEKKTRRKGRKKKEMARFSDAETAIMQEMSRHVDQLISVGSVFDNDVQSYCVKFQMEHASAKAEYQQSKSENLFEATCDFLSPEMDHLRRVLVRMIDFAAAVCQHVLRKCRSCNIRRSPSFARSASDSSDRSQASGEDQQTLRAAAGSVEDLGSEEFFVESGANLMHSGLEVMSLALLVHPALRSILQSHLMDHCEMSSYLSDALRIPKDQELSYFAEGYKTDHMKLVANLAFEHKAASKSFSTVEFLTEVLNGTKQDDDNPGMAEWAEFALRNICSTSEEARERIKSMKQLQQR